LLVDFVGHGLDPPGATLSRGSIAALPPSQGAARVFGAI